MWLFEFCFYKFVFLSIFFVRLIKYCMSLHFFFLRHFCRGVFLNDVTHIFHWSHSKIIVNYVAPFHSKKREVICLQPKLEWNGHWSNIINIEIRLLLSIRVKVEVRRRVLTRVNPAPRRKRKRRRRTPHSQTLTTTMTKQSGKNSKRKWISKSKFFITHVLFF